MTPVDRFEEERFELREGPAYIFRVNRREFLGVVGAGLWFIALEPAAQAQRSSGPGTLEGRLHIGEDGQITVMSGKIEEGQGARTELAMAAAEELQVPLSQIRMVMADTDVVPNDGITAGSRTTPSNVPATRRAAASARQLLVRTAAEKWGVAPEAIRVENGAAVSAGQKLTYADLARSPELTQAYTQALSEDVGLTSPAGWNIFGKPEVRLGARDMVTGAHKFPSDIERPGMLYGAVLRPPSFGATLTAIDLAAAKKEGAVAVHDGDFVGCAAPSSYQARKAVQALASTAQWKEKQHPSSDSLFEYLKQHTTTGKDRLQARGNVEQALTGAKNRLKATFQTAYIQHAPMEPRAAVAEWNEGKLTVWTGTSNPFSVRGQLAQAFGIPAEKVQVIVPDMGGGFGGKHTGEAAIEAARLAREAKKPVSLRWTRPEEFTWAYARPAALIEVEAALDDRKGILAWDFANYNSGGSALESPYRAANSRTRYIPSDSPLRQGSYRALAATANNFAREVMIDELAATASIDPLEFRLANLENARIREVLSAAAEKFNWNRRKNDRRPNRGVGLSCGTEKNSVVAACVEVEVDPATGTPRLVEIVQAYECGAILNPAGLRQQVEGCIIMGLGAALREELLFADGKLKNPRFSAYHVPRFRDVPKIELVLVDKKDADPIGAGETPIIAVAPAMANAIFMATGQRVRSMPFGRIAAKS